MLIIKLKKYYPLIGPINHILIELSKALNHYASDHSDDIPLINHITGDDDLFIDFYTRIGDELFINLSEVEQQGSIDKAIKYFKEMNL
jgi:hypothetical protein